MMLKRFGMFAVLAVCLFAVCFLVIAMGGCQDKPGTEIVTPPPPIDPPPTTETVPDGMVLIPAGSFEMGSDDADASDDERPVHTVHLDAFYMDVYEVTNAQFKVFVDANPQWGKDAIADRFHDGDYLKHWDGNDYPPGKGEHPVVWVS